MAYALSIALVVQRKLLRKRFLSQVQDGDILCVRGV